MTRKQILTELEKRLSPKRLKHCLAVTEIALELAPIYGISPQQTEEAALLHDIAKDLSLQESLLKATHLGYSVTENQKRNPALLHAPLGALILEQELGITDKTLLAAVKNHTTGQAGMSDLELLIFISDYLDGAKKMKYWNQVQKEARENLYLAALSVTAAKLEYVLESRRAMDEASIEFYHWLLAKTQPPYLKG